MLGRAPQDKGGRGMKLDYDGGMDYHDYLESKYAECSCLFTTHEDEKTIYCVHCGKIVGEKEAAE